MYVHKYAYVHMCTYIHISVLYVYIYEDAYKLVCEWYNILIPLGNPKLALIPITCYIWIFLLYDGISNFTFMCLFTIAFAYVFTFAFFFFCAVSEYQSLFYLPGK